MILQLSLLIPYKFDVNAHTQLDSYPIEFPIYTSIYVLVLSLGIMSHNHQQ